MVSSTIMSSNGLSSIDLVYWTFLTGQENSFFSDFGFKLVFFDRSLDAKSKVLNFSLSRQRALNNSTSGYSVLHLSESLSVLLSPLNSLIVSRTSL